MASICDEIILEEVLDENGDPWGSGNDFEELDCCNPRTLEFVFRNNHAGSIRVDNLDAGQQCGEPDIYNDGSPMFDLASVSGVAAGVIAADDTFSIFITVDPAALNCETDGTISGKFQLFPIEPGGSDPCCTFQQDFSARLVRKLIAVIDLGVQGNDDGYLQMTQTVGGSLSKGIIISNNGTKDRTYTFLQPGCWAGRFTSDFDLFTPFVVPAAGSQAVNITYTPTVEELDCCDMQATDDCEDPFQFTLCFEATISDPVDPPPPPPDPDPPGGTPPCQSLVDCRIADQGIEQLIRKSIVVDDDGCPAIRIILT